MQQPYLLHQLLERAAREAPTNVAICDRKQVWDYATLAKNAQRVAESLQQLGIGQGDRVALFVEKSAWSIAALYGILSVGAAYVPLDIAAPINRNATILSRAAVSAVVTTKQRVASLLEQSGADSAWSQRGFVLLGDDGPVIEGALQEHRPRPTALSDQAIAYVLHTSGSTGVPKGVAISHRNSLVFINAALSEFNFNEADRFALHAPLHFDLSVFDLFCAASVRGAVVVLPEFYSAFPQKMCAAIAEYGVTVWNSVVSALALLLDKGRAAEHNVASVRAIFFSGERMPVPLLARVREVFSRARLFNVYGQTEANSSMVYEVVTLPEKADASLPLGHALPNFEVFLWAEDESILKGEGAGELCVRSGSVASGAYFRDPERSAERFVQDPEFPHSGERVYRTGDLARRDVDGQLFLIGRRDSMVKTRGYRVELSEVEKAIEELLPVAESAVVTVPDEKIGNAIVAFLLGDAGQLDVKELAARLRTKLPDYMVPDPIFIESELPRTSSGKIDKQALINKAASLR
jgi:amino acid adenylation domain-containing protein